MSQPNSKPKTLWRWLIFPISNTRIIRTWNPPLTPFAGRVDRDDPKNVEVLKEVPDAAPRMALAEIFDLRGFLSLNLRKSAILECGGKPITPPEIESDPGTPCPI